MSRDADQGCVHRAEARGCRGEFMHLYGAAMGEGGREISDWSILLSTGIGCSALISDACPRVSGTATILCGSAQATRAAKLSCQRPRRLQRLHTVVHGPYASEGTSHRKPLTKAMQDAPQHPAILNPRFAAEPGQQWRNCRALFVMSQHSSAMFQALQRDLNRTRRCHETDRAQKRDVV